MLLSCIVLILSCIRSSSSDSSGSVKIASFRKPHAFSAAPIKVNKANIHRSLVPEPSPYKWFQEIYYSNSNCAGEPFRIFDYRLGTCFKDSARTSFSSHLIIKAGEDQIVYNEYSDDACGKVANSTSVEFVGSKFEDVDAVDASVTCEKTQFFNQLFSLRTLYFESEYNPVYPDSGTISRAFDMTTSSCPSESHIVSGSWHNENACVSPILDDMKDNPDYGNVERVRFVCNVNDGYPDVWGFSDENCQVMTMFHNHADGPYEPQCFPTYIPLSDLTPPQTNPGDSNSFMYQYCFTKPTSTPTTAPISSAQPSSVQPSIPAVSSGPDETLPGSGGGSDNSLFLMDSLSTELLIIVILASAAFCICAGTLVCFLCLRLHSQDSLNRDLMQTFAQLVDRNRRALRSVQEKFSQKSRRSQQVSKARETELSVQESRSLLSEPKHSRNSKANKAAPKSGKSSPRREGRIGRRDRDQEAGPIDDDDDDYDDDDEDDEDEDDEVF